MLSLFLTAALAQAEDLAYLSKLSDKLGQKVTSVKPSPIPGVLEVTSGRQVFYMDLEARYVISGAIFDLKTKKNITKERVDLLNIVDFKSLPFEKAINVRRGSGAHKLFVFSDPNCGFCKKLEDEFSKIKDADIYILPYPILSDESKDLAAYILCSNDPLLAWNQWMGKKIRPQKEICDVSIDNILVLGSKNSVKSTPTLIFEDGTRVTGFTPAKEISEKMLTSTAKR